MQHQPARRRAVARPKRPGEMNKTEARYATQLELRKQAGEIRGYRYEPVTFRLAKVTRYTPDFMVELLSGEMCFQEVKGARGDGYLSDPVGKVKIKIAAEMFPEFYFLIVWERQKRNGGGWNFQEF